MWYGGVDLISSAAQPHLKLLIMRTIKEKHYYLSKGHFPPRLECIGYRGVDFALSVTPP